MPSTSSHITPQQMLKYKGILKHDPRYAQLSDGELENIVILVHSLTSGITKTHVRSNLRTDL